MPAKSQMLYVTTRITSRFHCQFQHHVLFWIGQERSPKEENLVMGRNGTVKITVWGMGIGGSTRGVYLVIGANVTA